MTRSERPPAMQRRHRLLRISRILAVTMLLAAAASGQQQDLPEVFSEVVDVRVVNIEVVVTDRKGNRVHSLQASEFELLVDGEPTPIDYFTEIRDGFALEPGEGDVAAVPSLDPDTPVATNFLIYVDDFFSIERDRNRVLDRLEEDLGELGPADRVAAVAFDGSSVETLTAWTNSPGQLGEALDRARGRPAHGLERRSELRMVDSDRNSVEQFERSLTISRGLSSLASRAEIYYQEKLAEQLERSVLAAVATMRRFANQRGRKVMLLLAGGWPRSVKVYALGRPPVDDTEAIDSRVASEDELYGPLVSTANLIGFALYPVDVPAAAAGRRNPLKGRERQYQLRSTLQQLAARTGGVPMLAAQRDTALSRVVEDTRSYYWLGFEPQRHEDDAFHEIVVRAVGRSDLEVRTREGYVDMSRDREIAMTAEGALLFGDLPDALPLDVRLGAPVRVGRGRISVPMEVTIPLDEKEFLPAGDQSQSVLEVRVAVMDESGNRAEVSLERVPVVGPEQPQPGQIFYYETDLQLRRREHTVLVTVRDPLTGTTLSASREISPR
ncbi:MAG: VWA domain-containing protein [Acidobacteria bacterium]|nr:VWA domain-containing protein [Acidobacteriota bacterium]